MSECDTPLRMIVDNQVDEFDLTASPAMSTTLPVNFILEDQRSYVARSQIIQDNTVDFVQIIHGTHSQRRTLGADGVAIGRHNMTGSDDSYRIILFDENEVVFDSGEIPFAVLIPLGIWRVGVNWLGEPYDSAGLNKINVLWFPISFYTRFELHLTKRFFDHDKQDYTPWVDIGHLFIGLSISPERQFSWGNSLLWDDGQSYARTEGGSLVTEGGRPTFRELALDLDQMTDRDRNLFSTNLRRTAGKSILVAAYPKSKNQTTQNEYTMLCKYGKRARWSHQGVNTHSTEIKLLEI